MGITFPLDELSWTLLKCAFKKGLKRCTTVLHVTLQSETFKEKSETNYIFPSSPYCVIVSPCRATQYLLISVVKNQRLVSKVSEWNF